MKRILSIVLSFLMLSIGAQAQAFWTGSVYNNDLNAMVDGIMGLDWSSSGSGFTVGLDPNVVPTVGTDFTFLYQASLVGVTGPTGLPVAFPGLDTQSFEYTVVAMLPETVTNVIPLGGGLTTAVLTTQPGGIFAIYNQAVADANVLAGTGFNNGDLVVSGTINAGELTIFTGNATAGTGIGSTILNGLVNFVDPAFFDPALAIIDFRFEGTVNRPPLDSETNSFFDGNDGFAVTAVNIADTYKVDGSSKFSVVPEPSTILLMGAGLLGVAGFARRKMRI
jgi:hypothetical protein